MRLRSLVFPLLIGIVGAQFSNQWNPQGQQQQQQQFNQFPNGQQQQTNQWGQPQAGVNQNGYRLGLNGQPLGAQMNGNLQQNGLNNQQFRPGYGQLATTAKAAAPSLANVNSPSKLSSNQVNGAQVDIQIKGYSNPNNLVSNTTTCACTTNCDFLNANQQNACKFAFVTIISSADQSVQYYSTDFFAFDRQMDPRVGNWSAPISFQMTSKPVAIDVFVYQLGVAMSLPNNGDQQLVYFDRLMLVDSFVVNVFAYNASTGTPMNDVLPGKIIGTSMNIQWSVKCINGMLGNNCNLICGVTPETYETTTLPNGQQSIIPPLRTAVSSDTTLCKDTVSGVYSSCRYNAGRSQVIDCTTCVNGVTPNGTCNSIFTDVIQDDMVSSAFRTWTIVLGCLLGLAILVILCLIISYIIVRNREKEEVEYKEYKPNPYNLPPAQAAQSRPLLDDEWQTAPRRPIQPPLPPHQQEHDRASDDSYRNGHVAASTTQSRQEHQV